MRSKPGRLRRRPTRIPEVAWKVLWVLAAAGIVAGAPHAARAEESAPAKAAEPTAAAVAVDSLHADGVTLREKVYYYQAFNQRDPFASLIAGEFEETGELDIVDVYAVRLVGVLSGGKARFAMLEDNNGYAYIVKAGDPVRNGNVVSVTDRSLVARVTVFGQTSTVTLRLEERKSKGE
jgi:hypothetical protein